MSPIAKTAGSRSGNIDSPEHSRRHAIRARRGAALAATRTVWLLAAACAVWLLAAASTAADNGPHTMGAGVVAGSCAACHRAHTAQAPHLLSQPETELCYTCHGSAAGGSNLDVVDGIGYSKDQRTQSAEVGALRGGGFKYALIDSAHPAGQQSTGTDPGGEVPTLAVGAPVTSAHTVDSSSQSAWGNGPISAEVSYGKTISLRCGSCHDPHGNGDYRILRPIPQESVASEEVSIPDTATKLYTTANYWDVEDELDPAFLQDVSRWCATCHTRYLSETSYTESGDAVFTDRHISSQTTQGSAGCIQCHVAHGSNASVEEAGSMAVHSPLSGPAVPAGSGSRLLRIDNKGTCRMCHLE